MKLKALMGSGDRILLLTAPFLVAGLILNVLFPSFFSVGGPPAALKVISIVVLIPGVVLWLWSVVLILTQVPKNKLITHGPYALMKHPLYTSVALMVLPWAGFLFNSWLGVVVGLVMYVASRRFSPEEEKGMSKAFGAGWDAYCQKVMLPWL